MDGRKILLFIANLCWLVFVPLSTLGNSKVAAGNKEYTGRRKLATKNPGLISIDCGVDEDYLDKETGVFYKSDRDFISTGENKEVSPEYKYDIPNFGQQLNNIRIFPEGRKNCYTLQPEQGKNHNYLIQAFFSYGNYGDRNDTPWFELYLGVYYWATIQVPNASKWTYHEVIHFSSSDTIFVCLINTGFGIPSIAALELRLLNNSIYKTESMSIYAVRRYKLGSPTNISVWHRYKDDFYGRLWMSYSDSTWVSISNTSDIDIHNMNDSYKLPFEVLRTAIQPRSGLTSLNNTSIFSCVWAPFCDFYIYFHVAEIVETAQGQRREFTINLNGVSYGPISLEYLKPQTICSHKFTLPEGSAYVNLSIISTMQSSLPPILNALELYVSWPDSHLPTDIADVDAILAIKRTYKINRVDWQGDPCLPRGSSWSGLICNNDSSPRIISLNFSSSKLTGKITYSLSNLTAIQSLDFSYNELTGTVPEFLAQLPNLTILNLVGNKLIGSVPQSLIEKSNNGILQLSFDGNPNLCLTDSCTKKKQTFLLPIIASFISILVLLLFGIVAAVIWRMKRQEVTQSTKAALLQSKNRPFKYSEIVSITNNFRDIIGEGGFGKVYLGNLKDGTQVAVKLLSQSSRQGYNEFRAEVQLLMVVHHRNLVSLIGYCDEHENMALVYEYMANGNLQQHLSGTSTNVLHWKERLQIAVDAAHGLDYLHNGCKPPIVHRDLKTSNILLNENLQAKIADFGLSRVFATERDSHVTTRPAGTPGYLDPDFQASGNLNKKSDVYSFGILLFELITGQAVIIRGPEYNTHILQWVNPIIERGDIQSIIDPRLQGGFNIDSARKAVEIAKSCVPPTAIQRPDMSHVLVELKECLAMEMGSERKQMKEGNMERLCNSHDVCLELDTEMAPSPR